MVVKTEPQSEPSTEADIEKLAAEAEIAYQKLASERIAAASLFDPIAEARAASEIKEAYIPQLNQVVRFGSLNLADLSKIDKIADPADKSAMMVCLALQKATPELRIEHVRLLRGGTVALLAEAIARDANFFAAQSQGPPASKPG